MLNPRDIDIEDREPRKARKEGEGWPSLKEEEGEAYRHPHGTTNVYN